MINKKIELSNPLTFFFKFIFFPFWCLLGLSMLIIVVAAIPKHDWRASLIISVFISAMIFVAWRMIRKIRQVSYDDDFLYVKDFKEELKIELTKVKSVHGGSISTFSPFFEIEYFDDEQIISIKFIPFFLERLEYSVRGKFSGRVLAFRNRLKEIHGGV